MGQQVLRVLLLGVDQGRREDADDLIEFGAGLRQTQILAVRPAHVQVEIDEDAAFGQLVDEVVQPVEGLRLDGLAVLGVPDARAASGRCPCGDTARS